MSVVKFKFWAIIIATVFVVNGCKRESVDAPVEATSSVPADSEQLLADMEGVWATTESQGTDDAETVYMLRYDGNRTLYVVRDGNLLKTTLEDVDPSQSTVVVNHEYQEGDIEPLTFRKKPDDTKPGAFYLQVTYGNGQSRVMNFVRRLTDKDQNNFRAAFDEAPEEADEPMSGVEKLRQEELTFLTDLQCDDSPSTYLARTVCASDSMRASFDQLSTDFTNVSRWGKDIDGSRKAARKQLEACNNSECINAAIKQWSGYLHESFDTTEPDYW